MLKPIIAATLLSTTVLVGGEHDDDDYDDHLPPVVETTGTYNVDCASDNAWLTLTNTGNVTDRIVIGGVSHYVPAGATTQVVLLRLSPGLHMLGPVTSVITFRTVPIENRPVFNALGDVTAPCAPEAPVAVPVETPVVIPADKPTACS